MRIAASHRLAVIFEYLYVIDVARSEQIIRLIDETPDNRNNLIHAHARQRGAVMLGKAHDSTLSVLRLCGKQSVWIVNPPAGIRIGFQLAIE